MEINRLRNDPFDIDCEHAADRNEVNLLKILKDNAETEFGRKHGFGRITGVSEYRKAVPLLNYEDFEQEILRMANGEKNVLTSYPICQFIHTSGTSGQKKLIPLSEESLRRYGNIKDRINRQTMDLRPEGKRLQLVTYRTDPRKPPEKETLFSIANERNLYRNGWLNTEEYVGGYGLYFQPGMSSFYYPKWWAGILEPHVQTLESPFLYDHLLFFRYLEDHWEQILDDMRSRRISAPEGIPEEVQEMLLALPADPGRIDAVERECRKGFRGIAKRIWPELRIVCGIRGSEYSAEDKALNYYVEDVPRHYFCFVSSECFIGIPLRMDEAQYVIMPQSAFFEFLPYGGDEEGTETLLPSEAEVGKDYEIILTTFSGLYRYHSYDVVRVEDFYGQSPVVSFRLRKNLALNLCGEKYDFSALQHAGSLLCRELGLRECSFALDVSTIPGRYLCFAEAEEAPAGPEREKAASALERILTELNGEYADLRLLHCIGEPEVLFVKRGAHLEVKRRSGASAEQNKPLQVLTSAKTVRIMMEYIV